MTIAFFGAGLMGRHMALRLLAAGHRVTVYNRSPQKAETLKASGAIVAAQPEDALYQAQYAVVMLADAAAIRDVLLNEKARAALAGRTIIQMGTIAPAQSRVLADEIGASGGDYLEAPVLGSTPEAQAGTLIVMVGGTPEQFAPARPLLSAFGPNPCYVGPVGQAAALKLAMNQLIASLTAAFALSLGFVERAGVSRALFLEVLRASALYAPTFDKKLPRMADRSYGDPNFPTRHLLKDVNLFLAEAAGLQLSTDALEGVRRILEQTVARGLADGDYAALFDAVCPPGG